MSDTRVKRGSSLTPAEQKYVLSAYVHRYTMDHVPAWALEPSPAGRYYAPHYSTDQEWLDNTYFDVRDDGSLDRRHTHCMSTNESWPVGMWLSAPYKTAA